MSAELKKKLGMRAVTVRVNDTAKVMRGKFKGKTGKINKVNYGKGRVFLEGLNKKKADGTELPVHFNHSNLVLIDLDRSDSRRFKGKPAAKKLAENKEEKPAKKTEEKKEVKEVKPAKETKEKGEA